MVQKASECTQDLCATKTTFTCSNGGVKEAKYEEYPSWLVTFNYPAFPCKGNPTDFVVKPVSFDCSFYESNPRCDVLCYPQNKTTEPLVEAFKARGLGSAGHLSSQVYADETCSTYKNGVEIVGAMAGECYMDVTVNFGRRVTETSMFQCNSSTCADGACTEHPVGKCVEDLFHGFVKYEYGTGGKITLNKKDSSGAITIGASIVSISAVFGLLSTFLFL